MVAKKTVEFRRFDCKKLLRLGRSLISRRYVRNVEACFAVEGITFYIRLDVLLIGMSLEENERNLSSCLGESNNIF